jgi:hypothetical protein
VLAILHAVVESIHCNRATKSKSVHNYISNYNGASTSACMHACMHACMRELDVKQYNYNII